MTILIEKAVLNLPIEKGESEMRSYIDIKKHFKETWPFMWQVKNVKDKELSVDSKYKCEPFSSYSYLNLVRDKDVQNAAIKAAQDYASGNHGPRMLGGNMEILCELEAEISKFVYK
jgi:7-keto-8-aminopelargonate synthetase-like enzyme